jgi:hypothetical protein
MYVIDGDTQAAAQHVDARTRASAGYERWHCCDELIQTTTERRAEDALGRGPHAQASLVAPPRADRCAASHRAYLRCVPSGKRLVLAGAEV